MIQRILKAMAISTPIAVFCSLSFSGPSAGPLSSALDPLLPAPAQAASCYDHSYCPDPFGGCHQYQYETFCLQIPGPACCNLSQQQCVGGTSCP